MCTATRVFATIASIGMIGFSTVYGQFDLKGHGEKWSKVEAWDGQKWVGQSVTIPTYDSQNRMTGQISYDATSGALVQEHKAVLTYAADGLSLSGMVYTWDGENTEWVDAGSVAATLNADGLPTRLDAQLAMDMGDVTLTIATHVLMTYRPDGKLLSDSTWAEYNGANYGPLSKSNYTYSANTQIATEYSYADGEVSLSSKVTTTYDASQRELLVLTEDANMDGSLELSTVDSLFYDGDRLASIRSYTWDGDTWQPSTRETFYTTEPPIGTRTMPLVQSRSASRISLSARIANRELTVTYTLPAATTASVELYDLKGALVARLMNPRHVDAGAHVTTVRNTFAAGPLVCKLSTDRGTLSSLVIGR